jgi:hypothetical protein
MKDNTVLYLVLGGVALYLFTRRQTNILPKTYYPGGGYPGASNYYPSQLPVNQPSQSVVLPLITTVANLANKIFSPGQPSAATNVSNGYNADGTITLPNEVQTSIQNLNDAQLMQTTLPDVANILVVNSATADPSGGTMDESDWLYTS